MDLDVNGKPICDFLYLLVINCNFTIRYDTIEEINVDSKAEYTA